MIQIDVELIRLDEVMFFMKFENQKFIMVFEYEGEVALRFHLLQEKIERDFEEDTNNSEKH